MGSTLNGLYPKARIQGVYDHRWENSRFRFSFNFNWNLTSPSSINVGKKSTVIKAVAVTLELITIKITVVEDF